MKTDKTNIALVILLVLLVITATNLYLFTKVAKLSHQDVNQPSNQEKKQIPRLSIMPVGNGPTIGSANAPVSVIAFIDYECPFCKQFLLNTLPFLNQEYVEKDKVKIIFRDLPLESHPNAKKLAIAANVLSHKGEFLSFLSMVTSKEFNSNKFLKENDSLFANVVNVNKIQGEIGESKLMANIAGITATPAFVINSRILVGARSKQEFSELINYAFQSPTEMLNDKPTGNSCN